VTFLDDSSLNSSISDVLKTFTLLGFLGQVPNDLSENSFSSSLSRHSSQIFKFAYARFTTKTPSNIVSRLLIEQSTATETYKSLDVVEML
jgi:hypothetical protein